MADFRNMGLDPAQLIEFTLHDLLDYNEETSGGDSGQGAGAAAAHHAPSRAYVRDAKAMAATPADVKDMQNAYVFVIDMPGLKQDQIKVHVEEDNVLIVSGERRREKEKDQGVKYLRMERRLGKYLKKFVLPENADTEKINASYQDGVLTVTIEKKPPPEPKKPKTIEVQVA